MNDIDPFKVKPLGGHIVVEVEPRQTRTASGIELPLAETGIEKVMEGAGRVIAAGPGKMSSKGVLLPMGVKVGDRVLFRRFLKDWLPLGVVDGKEYTLLHAHDMMAVADDEVQIGPF